MERQANEIEQQRQEAEDRRQQRIVQQDHERQTELERQRHEREMAKKQMEAEEQTKREICRIEADNKRELAEEETKRLDAKARAEEAITAREHDVALEKTRQVKIENEERTKQSVEEQHTKQMVAMNETLSHCVKLTEQLAKVGSSKQEIKGLLEHVLGSSEKVQKVMSHTTKVETRAAPNESEKSKFLAIESINQEQNLVKSKHLARPRVHTAPVVQV